MNQSILAYKKQIIRNMINKLTYPTNWSKNPETIKKVQSLSAELEQIGLESKVKKQNDSPELQIDNLDVQNI